MLSVAQPVRLHHHAQHLAADRRNRAASRQRIERTVRASARGTVPGTKAEEQANSAVVKGAPGRNVAETQTTPDWVSGWQKNVALAGNFAPVATELTWRGLPVEGRLPSAIDGVWMRNGPNPRFEPEPGSLYHWFDGDGMVHWLRFRSESNTADYGCRYLQTRGFKDETKAGKRLQCSVKDAPIPGPILRGLVSKIVEGPDSPYWIMQNHNLASNGLRFHRGRLLATYETGSAYEVRLGEDLEVLGPCDFNGTWKAVNFWNENFTAHSKVCGTTGELLFTGYNLIPIDGDTKITVGSVGLGGSVDWRVHVRSKRLCMMHDFGVTESRIVLFDCPMTFGLVRSAQGGHPFEFKHGEPIYFGVLPRAEGAKSDPQKPSEVAATWIQGIEGYSYHVVNCWDLPTDPNRVVICACVSPETCALGMADDDAVQDSENCDLSNVYRFEVDVAQGRLVEARPLSSLFVDFPVINPRRIGKPCRFAWFAEMRKAVPKDEIPLFDCVVKQDLETGEVLRRPLGRDTFCGDMSFVPAGDADVEGQDDDGYLLVLTHNLREDTSEMLVLSARDVTAEPVARVPIPARIPFGFHCEFVGTRSHGATLTQQWP